MFVQSGKVLFTLHRGAQSKIQKKIGRVALCSNMRTKIGTNPCIGSWSNLILLILCLLASHTCSCPPLCAACVAHSLEFPPVFETRLASGCKTLGKNWNSSTCSCHLMLDLGHLSESKVLLTSSAMLAGPQTKMVAELKPLES
mmetsp:Transcript_111021/g.264945  ORF Transcript_111021/g.264945 Transcript_111021/m.264945 type:complete len:143 (+) Transcript_111021:208-636(+)